MFAASQPLRALGGPLWLRGAPTRTPQTAADVPLTRMGFVEQLCDKAAVRDPPCCPGTVTASPPPLAGDTFPGNWCNL